MRAAAAGRRARVGRRQGFGFDSGAGVVLVHDRAKHEEACQESGQADAPVCAAALPRDQSAAGRALGESPNASSLRATDARMHTLT